MPVFGSAIAAAGILHCYKRVKGHAFVGNRSGYEPKVDNAPKSQKNNKASPLSWLARDCHLVDGDNQNRVEEMKNKSKGPDQKRFHKLMFVFTLNSLRLLSLFSIAMLA